MRFEVDFNTRLSAAEISAARDKAIEVTSQQALKDCNFYCKQDTETLIKSSLIHSDTAEGVLKWVTPYAEYQYKFPSARKDRNPNASPEWCAKAEATHGGEWERVFKTTHERELGG